MKKYKYTFPTTALVFLILGCIASIACFTLNVIRFSNLLSQNVEITLYNYISIILSVLLSLAFLVIAITAYFNSYYSVKDKKVVLKWGVVKNVIDLKEVKEIKLLTNNLKLELIFNDDTYFVIATRSEWFESFIDEIKTEMPNVLFTQETNIEK
jgi:hypothetical protein